MLGRGEGWPSGHTTFWGCWGERLVLSFCLFDATVAGMVLLIAVVDGLLLVRRNGTATESPVSAAPGGGGPGLSPLA